MDSLQSHEMDSDIVKKQCTNCKCWRIPSDFIGAKGNEVKRCKKCRDKDTKQKKKPEVIERRNEVQRERKYYQVYRDRKRAEDEEAYKKKCAEASKVWRDNNKEHHTEWCRTNINYNLYAIKSQALKKGIVWSDEMTKEHARELMASDCFYCKKNDVERVNGIDRMDNTRGYEPTNTVPCCKYCNFVKKSLDARTFVERCIHIASSHGQGDQFFPNVWVPRNRTSYNGYRYRAIKKELVFELDSKTFEAIANKDCYYCKRPNTLYHQNGVDRMDNRIGYIVDNCVACCWDCNAMKTNMSVDDYINTCKRVAANASNIKLPDMPRCYNVNQRRIQEVEDDDQDSLNESENDDSLEVR